MCAHVHVKLCECCSCLTVSFSCLKLCCASLLLQKESARARTRAARYDAATSGFKQKTAKTSSSSSSNTNAASSSSSSHRPVKRKRIAEVKLQ
jgi:hypothetical protein